MNAYLIYFITLTISWKECSVLDEVIKAYF